MRASRQPSWDLSLSTGGPPLTALVLRQLLALEVPSGPAIPPTLEANVPVWHGADSDGVRAAWVQEWPTLWSEVLRCEFTGPGNGASAVRAWASKVAADVWESADRLADAIESDDRAVLTGPDAPLARVAGEVAGEMITQHGISPERVQGSLHALPVHGQWWHLVAPGQMVCSAAALGTVASARTVIRAVFEPGLSGQLG